MPLELLDPLVVPAPPVPPPPVPEPPEPELDALVVPLDALVLVVTPLELVLDVALPVLVAWLVPPEPPLPLVELTPLPDAQPVRAPRGPRARTETSMGPPKRSVWRMPE